MTTKHFLTGATLLSGLLLLNAPLFAAVESDVVGYSTVTTSADFTMLGVVFKGLSEGSSSLNDIISGDFAEEDQIQLYDRDSGYRVYSYYNGSWVDGDFNPLTFPVEPGTAFWLVTPGRTVTVTLKGAIPTGDYRYESRSGLQMVSPHIPVALDLNNGVKWGGALTENDEIQVRVGNSYRVFPYYDGKWVDGNFMPLTEKIPVGTSIWLKTQNAGVTMTVQGIQ